ncbi:DsrE/DsrF/DrsH-like family protein [Kozakia baliensis]|uniref:Uncharacterized protein n=1 Tax=Kozakia baliensis TaxID=153496 RepID=A0A1D8UR11_9PROT|nr:DsrE/DsrF/DrsH-like family protein [Kozakia baliensis]AOX16071.1 hypothetical protein A0U89_01765 [Kozakia baliensis]GBR23190.1 hypothetical protein AA0488_0073 [Kozakia baliensis NRIC 0488]GEL65106.1 hypothetical protein KBA01_23920 [Kozakia baliensis]
MSRILAITLADDSFPRAHHALVMAAGALSIGRSVVFFGGGLGVQALCREWRGLAGSNFDAVLQERGVASFEMLREAVFELGAEMLACESGLRAAGLDAEALCMGVEVCGVTRFLERAGDGQILAI